MMVNDQPLAYPFDEELGAAVPYLPELDYTDIAGVREVAKGLIDAVPPADLTGVTVDEVEIAVSGGETITLLITTPDAGERPLPLIYDVHPGGFCVGSSRDVQPRDAELAREVQAIVVAPDYRLAPEHPYPVPVEDCYAGLVWVANNAPALGGDPTRIAVHGQSAGGGLAAGLTLLARDRGTPEVAFQYLAYPEIDDRLDSASIKRFVDTPFFNRPNASASWRHYLGTLEPGSPDVPIYAAPARLTDASGLAPTYIGAMQFDPLRDEAIAFAQKLLEADVSVELHLFPLTFHYSRAIVGAEVSRRELAEEVAVLQRALHGVGVPALSAPS